MLLLALNSATTTTAVALLQNGRIIFEKSWFSNRDEMEKLLPTIQLALKKGKATFAHLDAIFVVAGPGSFSGLRIGVTIANALAFSQKIPLFSCDTFQLLSAKIPEKLKTKTAIIISAGGSQLAVVSPSEKSRQKAIQIDQQELPAWLKSQKNLTHLLADLKPLQTKSLQQMLKTSKLKISLLKPAQLQTFGQAVQVFLTSKPKSQAMIKPIYLRKPTITKSKKELFV